ncbi:hypothetical protein A5788_22250 [Gordonia sp. 852002-50816_SCH5313054-c]|uniref:hypothetical protein n=1 Tax=unclassified Gordonia (in: high G+C Gram-positive bacteria) TaxID=2657482 RepID=UPI0007EBD821|nr:MULTISPECIES: hypothetical protein [unclassified Gordonia (in: high G+C Gram-positive bacteria)]OBC12162.1 hypothetical protein A5788_22250 [Gordonia sp. 852002-50816_SCH5313054-c]OBC17587.1 hypothetical protein A5786_18870 [Gordonia sp. 852002-50816_SCH5313054-a]
MSDIVERAERLLAGITPGPWWWTNELRQRLIAGGSEDDLSDAREIVRCAALLHPDKADAEFIAAAPQLVADLLAEVKRLEGDLQMVADFAGAATDVRDIVRQLRAQRCVVASLSAEVKRLRDVMDELTDVLYVPTDEIVDAVRRRLTPRVIETQAEVNALPAGAVVRENGPYPEAFVYEKYLDETECDYRWLYPGDSDPQIEPPLPVTVLYAPEGGDL